jgi:phosphatidate cytidylyltransferase
MAFDRRTFITRAGSAVVFAILMLAGLLMREWTFIILFFVINLICLHEYARLVEGILQTTFSRNERVNFISSGILFFLLVSSLPITPCENTFANLLSPFTFILLGACIGALLIFFLFRRNKQSVYLLTGLGYIPFALGFLVQLRYQSLLLPLILILMIWMNDTMAYLSGSFLGKHKLMPSVSPKKTIEGTLGGIVCTMLLAWLWASFTNWFPVSFWIGMALVAGVAGTAGDLIESKLKRLAGVKDSGNLMPGHGGALDRFDSLLFAAPFAFILALVYVICKPYVVF